MSNHTTRLIPASGADRKIKDTIMESEHFLVAEIHEVNTSDKIFHKTLDTTQEALKKK